VGKAAIGKRLGEAGERYRIESERLITDRDEAIRQAHRDGLTYKEIAEAVGLSFQRVAQVIKGTN
jgi:DNA-directed RNA polymerase specialized sigma24 family protein